MNPRIPLALVVTALAACQAPAPRGSASAPPAPTRFYECADGTKLEVRLTGEAAMVSVNGSDEIQLKQLSGIGTRSFFTNGQETVEIGSGSLSWGLGRDVPVECKGV